MYLAEYLADQSVAFETVLHPPAYTAQKRAKFLRVSGHQVVKNVLLKAPRGYVLAVLPATQHINIESLQAQLDASVRLASQEEMSQVFPDCELGALTPFGSLYGLPTLLEACVPSDAVIVCEAQRHALAVRILCRDFERIERPLRLHFGL